MKIDICGYSHIGNRPVNEDSYRFAKGSEVSGYAVVADGLGSHGGGEVASAAAVAALSQYEGKSGLPSKEEILQWMSQANEEILRTREGPWHMKTTAVALYFFQNQAIWAHTGDSRLYHFYNGTMADATADQSVCQLHVMQGEITREQIPSHPDRSRLLYVLGDEKIRPIVHDPIQMQPGKHAFLLCSDGVWERLAEWEILMELSASSSAKQWLEGLRVRADVRKNEEVDNNTAITMIIEV